MGLIKSLVTRDKDIDTSTKALRKRLRARRSAGASVNERTATQIPAVLSAVRCISESLASLPLDLFRRADDGSKQEARDRPLFDTLKFKPNDEMTSFQFRETMMFWLLTWGNAYAQIQRGGNEVIMNLWPLSPKHTKTFRMDGDIFHKYQPPGGGQEIIRDRNMFHIKGLSRNGVIGLSPIQETSQALGLAKGMERFAANKFENSAAQSGHLKHPNTLSDEARENIREEFERANAGIDNAGNIAVLEEGMEFEPSELSPVDLEMLEERRFQLREIARIFRIQPHLIQDLEDSTFCLPAGESVFTEEGPKPIEDIDQGEKVWSYGEDGMQLQEVKHSVCTGTDKILKIKTTNRTIRCNKKHPVLCRRKDENGDWQSEYVQAGDLEEEDVIVTLSGLPNEGSVDACPTRKPSTEFMELCGLLLGDGWLDKKNGQVCIARADDAGYMDHYRDIMEEEFFKGGYERTNGEDHWNSELTKKEVDEIREANVCSKKDVYREVSNELDLPLNTVADIGKKEKYQWDHPQSVMSESEYKDLENKLKEAVSASDLADQYSIKADTVRSILRHEIWNGGEEVKKEDIHIREGERCTSFSSAEAVRELSKLGLDGTAHTKSVPGWIFQMPEAHRLAFLRGYFDADGYVNKKGRFSCLSASKDLIEGIRHLCTSCGIPVTNMRNTNRTTTLPNGNKASGNYWEFTCSDPGSNRKVGSNIKFYNKRLKEGKPFDKKGRSYPKSGGEGFSEQNNSLAKITSIEEEEEAEPVYDLEVEGTHSFVAEGVIVHNSNIETQSLEFVKYTLRPWLVRWEHAIRQQLIPDASRDELFAEFNVDGLLRGDAETRAEFYRTGFQNGFFSPNDIRKMENLNPVDGGDTYYRPLNMTPIDGPDPELEEVKQQGESARMEEMDITTEDLEELGYEKKQEEEQPSTRRQEIAKDLQPVFEDAAGRIVRRELFEIEQLAQDHLVQGDLRAFSSELRDLFFEEASGEDSLEFFFKQQMRPHVLSLTQQVLGVLREENEEEIDLSASELTDEFINERAGKYAGRSVGTLLEKLKEQRSENRQDELFDVAQEEIELREENKQEKMKKAQPHHAENFVSLAAYKQLDVQIVWVAVGKSCPICNGLDGRDVSAGDAFVSEGESVAIGYEPNDTVIRPPAHRGCDCTLVRI